MANILFPVLGTLSEDVSNKALNLKLLDPNTGASLRTFAQFSDKYLFNAIAYSRDGKLVASGDNYVQNNLRVWDVASGSLLHSLAGHQPATNAVALSPLGGQLVSGGPDSLVIVWDLSTSVASLTLKGHKQHVMSVVYTPDGQRIASGAADGSIRWWEASTGLSLKNVSVTDTSGPIGSSFGAIAR